MKKGRIHVLSHLCISISLKHAHTLSNTIHGQVQRFKYYIFRQMVGQGIQSSVQFAIPCELEVVKECTLRALMSMILWVPNICG